MATAEVGEIGLHEPLDSNSENEDDEEDEGVAEFGDRQITLADLSTARGPARQSSYKTAAKHFRDFCLSESSEDHINFDVFKTKTAENSWAVLGRFASYLLAKRKGECLHFSSPKGLRGIIGCIRGEINKVCGENFLSKFVRVGCNMLSLKEA